MGSGTASDPATSVAGAAATASSAPRTSTARGRFGSRRRKPFFSRVRSWCATEEVDVSPTASPISRMLGGYPRVVTDSRMTFKMVRCRWVSDESTACSRALEPVAEVSLLSLMALNVACCNPRIKHVFDWRVATSGSTGE